MNSLDKYYEMQEDNLSSHFHYLYAKPPQFSDMEESIKKSVEEMNNQNTPEHYDNSKGSLYKFSEDHNLNPWEFDILKRIVRCRKKGQFKEDLEKTIEVIKLYLKEYENKTDMPANYSDEPKLQEQESHNGHTKRKGFY